MLRSCLNYSAVFPGAKKRKSNNDDMHDHGQEKMRPSTYIEGDTISASRVSLIRFWRIVGWRARDGHGVLTLCVTQFGTTYTVG